MGEVWRAEHRMLARGAAIKLIRPAALGRAAGGHAGEMMKRFEREAQATAAPALARTPSRSTTTASPPTGPSTT